MVELAVRMLEAGCNEIGLADTTGYANIEIIQGTNQAGDVTSTIA